MTGPTREERLTKALTSLLDALDTCESNRGRFSCTDVHDARCPKSRSPHGAEGWRGVWACECGSEALDMAHAAGRDALSDAENDGG